MLPIIFFPFFKCPLSRNVTSSTFCVQWLLSNPQMCTFIVHFFVPRCTAKAHHSHKCTQTLSDLRSWVWSREQRRQSHWSASRRRRCLCWWQGVGPGNPSAYGHTKKDMLTTSTNQEALWSSKHEKVKSDKYTDRCFQYMPNENSRCTLFFTISIKTHILNKHLLHFWLHSPETSNMNCIDCICDLCANATFAGAAACQGASEADHKQLPIGSALKMNNGH